MNFKTNKRKFVAKIMLLVLLATSALSFAGCAKVPDGYINTDEYRYTLSQKYYGDSTLLKIKAISDKTVFDIDDISFKLIYGTHANKYMGRQDIKNYESEDYLECGTRKYEDYTFALYICEGEVGMSRLIYGNEYVDNIENIEGHKLIKIINSNEAFSDEYGYLVRRYVLLSNFDFKHVEDITIPKEYIKGDSGSFLIKIVAFWKDTDTNQDSPYIVEYIVFEYEKIENDTVKIKFYDQENKK